ncbi:MAG TPA: hypothetical protein VJ304_02390, partial [Flavobacterium sp.]|nr:hypothetical protein [Flavobacterium sp.]
MITYLLKSGVLLLIFFAVYKLLLENERMFRFNRVYLLGSMIFSLIIPLQLFSIESIFFNKIKVIQLDEIMIVTNRAILDKVNYNEIIMNFLSISYAVIAGILIFRFVRNVYSFYNQIKKCKVEIIDGQKMVLTK